MSAEQPQLESTAARGLARGAVLSVALVYGIYGALRAWQPQLAGFALVGAFLFVPLLALRRRPDLARRFEVGPESPIPPWSWAGARGAGVAVLAVMPLFTLGFWWFYAAVCGSEASAAGVVVTGLSELELWLVGSERVSDFVGGVCTRHEGGLVPTSIRFPASWSDWSSGGWVVVLLVEVLVVAVPEEVFHRGYLMSALEARWPPRARVLGVPLGLGAVLSSALFALGHLVGDMRVDRLATFFPALLFAWLWRRSGSLWAPVLFHAAANLLMQVVLASTFPSP